MIEINGKKLCENCFEEVNGAFCEHCGYNPAAADRDLTTLPPGAVLIGKYIVGKVMGKGGFGVTYLAYDVTEGKKVAVKEFFPYGVAVRTTGYTTVSVTSADKTDIFKLGSEKFYDEAKLVSKFSGNPNIVSVYGFFYENNTVYFSMEYLRGHTLKEHIQKYGVLNTSQAMFIIRNMANALDAAHGLSVLHRDISPDNIIICDNGNVKLIDFGAARQVVAEQSQTFSVILKPGFAPLEQYQKKGNQGPWTDIYSLGATVYYALTGEIPEDSLSRMNDDGNYRSNKHKINPDFWNIISKATELTIENRYENISQLSDDLDKISIEAAPLVVPNSVRQTQAIPYNLTQAAQQASAVSTPAPPVAYIQTEAYPQPLQQTVAVNKPAPAKSRTRLIAAICGASAAVIAAAIIIPIALNSSKNDISASKDQDGTIVSDNVIIENVVDREYTYNGTTIIYTGEWANGMPEGQGKATYDDGNFYEGEWKNGMRCGEGRFTSPESGGAVYDGAWENDNANGYGKCSWMDGEVYEGEWKDSRRDGQGKCTYANGDFYEGEWKNGLRNGQGEYTFADGGFYKGEWKDNQFDGNGVITYADGSTYDGEWKNNQYNGYGKCTWSDGTFYEGEWKDGKYNGYGKCTWSDDTFYEGEWKDGVSSGQGKGLYPNGDFYEGEWEDGLFDGKGLMTYANGNIYDGEWKDGAYNGYGKFTWSDGGSYEGEWKDGEQNGYGVSTYPDGTVLKGNWKNGKWIS